MPNYRWSCRACGLANARDAAACSACACPASTTTKAIAACRTRHLERGGALQGDAAVDAQRDLTAFEVLVRPLLLLLTGWWPGRRPVGR